MEYHFRVDSQNVEGPVSAAELFALRAHGQVAASTQVRQVGTDEWKSYEDEFYSSTESLDIAAFFEPALPLSDTVPPPPLWQPTPLPQPLPHASGKLARSEQSATIPVGPPPVHAETMMLPAVSGPLLTQPAKPWYKRTGWSIVLFYFFSPVMLPLMWYWKLYTRKVRTWVTAGFAGLLLLVVIVGTSEQAAIQREFDEKKGQLLAQVKAADGAHNYALVIRLGERYESVHDPQLDTYLHNARAGLKAAPEQERVEKATAAPVTSWSHLTKTQWKDKAARSFNWFALVPLQAPATRFQEVMGKPDHTQTIGDEVFWYYECSDGSIQMNMDAANLQTMGLIQAQVHDY